MTNNQIILIIIFGTGLLTGSTNYFLTCDLKLSKKDNWIKFLSSVLLSMCASLTVPLFLQILSNNLLDDGKFKNNLIFIGFCVLAGFYSKRFLSDLYVKVKNLENKVEKEKELTGNKLKQTEKDTEAINKKVEDLEESIEEVESENVPEEIKESLRDIPNINLSREEIEKLINALFTPKYSLRTLNGISKESGISKDKLTQIMEYLRNFGFVESKEVFGGKAYWRILKYPIKIYSANYGIVGHYRDVSLKLKNMISQGEYQGTATQAFLGIPDPAPGIVKNLKVHYRIHGKEKDFTVREGDTFKIE